MRLSYPMPEEIASPANALGEADVSLKNALPAKTKLLEIACANPVCGKTFKQNRRWQRFCSVVCRNQEFWSRHERATLPVVPEQQTKNQ